MLTGLIFSCTAPKELVLQYKIVDTADYDYKPTDFVMFPSIEFNQWLTDMKNFHINIPREVQRNQIGMSFTDPETGNRIYFINPSARPRVMVDTLLRFTDTQKIIGNWQVIASQRILYKDSVSLIDSIITRTNQLLDNNLEEVIVTFDENTMKLYAKNAGSSDFGRKFSRKYKILNGNYLLIYNTLQTTSGTSFVGLTQENELIWDNYFVRDELKDEQYKTYTTIATRMILKKLGND